MGRFHVMQNYFAIFLALVACNYFPLTHSRQVKPLNHPSSLSTGTVVVNNVPSSGKKKIEYSPMKPNYDVASFGDSGAGDTHAFRPTTPGNSPGVGHKKFAQEDNSMKVMVGVQSTDGCKPTNSGHSPGVGHAFRPTTPGNSPGVGHKKFAQEDNSMKVMVGVQSTDGFKPTNPGHSPGVGHAYQTKIGHLN